MTSQLRAARPAPAALLAATVVLVAGLLLGAGAARAEGTIDYTKEAITQYESQLAGNQIQSVVVNKRTRSLRVTLKNGQHVFAKYGKKEGPKYYAAVTAHHVPLSFLSTTQAASEQGKHKPGHKIRYIAGGALLLVIAIVAGVLIYNRRRQAARDYD